MKKEQIIEYLSSGGEELFELSSKIKREHVGEKCYLRGLIEYSNTCRKDCLYCGIRKSNTNVVRYTLSNGDVLAAAEYAYKNNFGSIVIQGGEISSEKHISTIENLIKKIKGLSCRKLGITLSLGEQTLETYHRWKEAGAHRYLLRIESSDQKLYEKIHPTDSLHSHRTRIKSLHTLRETGFQVGTGVMIGLPFQTIDTLANDLLFMKEFDIDMCGMGPYLEHCDTPLYEYRDELLSLNQRFELSLRMIAVLRIIMPEINIAATTALQTIDPQGREKAIQVGANIVMPNITPFHYKNNYKLYENKPVSEAISIPETSIGLGEWGDSKHFKNRKR